VLSLAELLRRNDALDRQRRDLAAQRAFNHEMVAILDHLRPLEGNSLLDLGCSYRGWAVEEALVRGAALAHGVGLAVAGRVEIQADRGRGELVEGQAESLEIADASFDLALSLSTFEHFLDPAGALRELARVLRPGGAALISFEPVWTAPNGHHLHHFGEVTALVPPWGHLLHDEAGLHRKLSPQWPASAPLGLAEAMHWVYRSNALNRRPLAELRQIFEDGPLKVEWMVELPAVGPPELAALASEVAARYPCSPADLQIRGLSLFLSRPGEA